MAAASGTGHESPAIRFLQSTPADRDFGPDHESESEGRVDGRNVDRKVDNQRCCIPLLQDQP